jgi:hypothetical protein
MQTWTVSTQFVDLFDLPEEMVEVLLPFLPKFQHALLDLSRFDPATQEHDMQLRAVLLLMKLVRERDALAFYHWLANKTVYAMLRHELVLRLLNYTIATNSKLDLEKIYLTVSINPELEHDMMSAAEELKAEGRLEGRAQGKAEGERRGDFMGRIQSLEEFLDLSISSREALGALSTVELEQQYQTLHRDYEERFKRS